MKRGCDRTIQCTLQTAVICIGITSLDLKSGYLQVKLRETYKAETALQGSLLGIKGEKYAVWITQDARNVPKIDRKNFWIS